MSDTQQTTSESKSVDDQKKEDSGGPALHDGGDEGKEKTQSRHETEPESNGNEAVKKSKVKKQGKKEAAGKDNKADRSEQESPSRQKEYIKLELYRLEDSLKKESSKLQPPPKKPYTPYLFNSLEPYYNTHTARYLIHMPEEQLHTFSSRATAQTLIDPWVDLRMSIELPPITQRQTVSGNDAPKTENKTPNKKSPNKVAKENPPVRFPVIKMDTKDLDTKPLFYSDVPALRDLLRTKYSANAQAKIEDDYKRTQYDFYRMELDRLEQVHPVNRKHMTGVYFAYLQNTPGSKKAVTECVGNLKVD
ncbi:hypothetical protein Btru_072439 [Bulinus truncatus]|nr:hypothetical protein Btru_072439 [Bulinus truncatus]